MILGLDNEGPEHTEFAALSEQTVPLRRWSDVVFLTWQNLCRGSERTKKLKWIFRLNITNDKTKKIIAEVMRGDIHNLKGWPGNTFIASQTSGLALLGTPHGAGVAWLLAQHKEQFGFQRTVAKITVWDGKAEDFRHMSLSGPKPSMLFELSDP